MKSVFQLVIYVAIMLAIVPRSASALPESIDIYYNPTGSPPGTQASNVPEMERVIGGVLREWEQHTFSAFNPIYRGTTDRTNFCHYGYNGRAVVIIQWGSNGVQECARFMWEKPGATSWPWCSGVVFRITLNSDVVSDTRGTGDLSCANVRHRLHHEFGHMLHMTPFHPDNSVLMVGSAALPFVRSHLWSSDIHGVAEWNVVYNWPRAGGVLSLDRYNMSSATSSSAGGTIFTNGFNHTGALSAGGSGFAYARVITDHAPGIFFEQGDGSGSNWQAQRFINASTYHRTCLATTTDGLHMVAAWIGTDETLLSNLSDTNPNAGTRPIRFVESHDSGNSWTSPVEYTGMRSRSGVGCSYDYFQNRFLLTAADNAQIIRVAHRLPTAGSNWSAANALLTSSGSFIQTAETPLISFDTFSSSQDGFVAWYDTNTNDNHMMRVRFRWCTQIAGGCSAQEQPGKYFSESSALSPWVDAFEPQILRSSIIPNTIEGLRHWAHSMQLATIGVNRRRGFDFNSVFLNSFTDYTAASSGVPWSLSRYHASGANRTFFETAYLVYNNNG
ncbi:MAG: hypothetical protein Q8Q09_14465 [Deltaproteobacteria bacterium]|nr:hypothetical protein [Deltaproteobacteria bacterium]